MAQELGWWTEVVFGSWRDRPGPRYQRLATALVDAVQGGTVVDGTRLPAERRLADALGVSRGTMVACFDHLVAAGVLRRRQGAGTFVVGRPSWTHRQPSGSVAALLVRRMATGSGDIDLSLSAPGSLGHLPRLEPEPLLPRLDGSGLDPAGLPVLRNEVARHLSEHQQLPTAADQVIVTAGAQEALGLIGRVLRNPRSPTYTTCPTYPGLPGALADHGGGFSVVPADQAGMIPQQLERAVHRDGPGAVYVMSTGHNPTGTVTPAARRRALAAIAHSRRCTVVEDLALGDLVYGDPPPPPIAASSDRVLVVGSASKLLWAGLRIGWIRVDGDLRRALIAHKAASSLATSAAAQLLAADLLARVDRAWLEHHRRALELRRNHLHGALARALPGWRCQLPSAGLSLWVELPVVDAEAYAHVASRHGVTVAPGSTACVCGDHHDRIRLSFAEPLETLDLAVERLASAWEAYSEDVAAAPARRPAAS